MILARTLCELSGARLTFTIADDGSRTWTVDFLPVTQNDLFSWRGSRQPSRLAVVAGFLGGAHQKTRAALLSPSL